MTARSSRLFLLAAAFFHLTTSLPAADPLFEKDVRPILRAHCVHCHGEQSEPEGGLDMRLRRFIVKGGDSGAALTPGKRKDSLMFQRIVAKEMPPEESPTTLSAAEIETIGRWIDAGAKTARAEPESLGDGLLITQEDREFWSFQPIARPDVPAVKRAAEAGTAIDRFLLKRLEEQSRGFAATASRERLIRRAYQDLWGLPPSPADIDAFLADTGPDAWERLIDRLLASPHYGERWGRHWLDVAGYADSEGYTDADTQRPWAYKYRDYVIRAFNADKPFDVFVREQLAGDEMMKPPYKNMTAEQAEKLIATGFLQMAPDGSATAGAKRMAAANDTVAESMKIVSTSLLGLTVGCAQCHHHRYDPISQHDYYRFRAIFEPAYDYQKWRVPAARRVSLYTDADKKRAAEIEAEAKQIDAERTKKQTEFINRTLEKELAKLPEDMRKPLREARDTPVKKRTPEQTKLLQKHPSVNVSAGSLYLYDRKAADELKKIAARATKLRGTKPKQEFIRAITEVPGRVPAMRLFNRGDFEQPKEVLEPASLSILTKDSTQAVIPPNDKSRPTTGRRLAYAKRLTDGTHPLLARVIANRIWLHHFGRGLVSSPGDFGRLGERPTHPLLLDWLASEFMSNGWSVKQLHRLIMTSSAYRQGWEPESSVRALDPDNRLYGWATPRRTDAESLRDAILTISGKRNDKPFGPAIPVMADRVGQWVIGKENLNAGRPGAVIPMNGEEFRRSVYVQVRRTRPLSVMKAFDLPEMAPNCEVRSSSTVAPQALMLMNSDFIVTQSEHIARRLIEEAGKQPGDQITLAYRLAFARRPSQEEVSDAVAYLKVQTEHFTKHPRPAPKKGPKPLPANTQALAVLCQMLLSSNEFLYVD